MRRIFLGLGLAALLLAPKFSWAEKGSGDQGYGIMLGNPSGLSAKFWFSNQIAIDGALGVDRGELDAHVTFLYHDHSLLQQWNIPEPTNTDMSLYVGAGPRFLFADNDEFGIRFPVGVTFFPRSTPWEFFAELAPVLRLTPDTGFNGDFGIGARYYFDTIRPRQ
jgi:hypothetical protein